MIFEKKKKKQFDPPKALSVTMGASVNAYAIMEPQSSQQTKDSRSQTACVLKPRSGGQHSIMDVIQVNTTQHWQRAFVCTVSYLHQGMG